MLKDSTHRSKKKVAVNIKLEEGTVLDGFVFCSQDERVSDILNDTREFLPFETPTGEVMMLRKGVISNILTREKSNRKNPPTNPFEILGIFPTASRNDVKQAYHAKVRLYHPDKLNSLNLPDDVTDYASDALARINSAYSLVMRQLEAETLHQTPAMD